jgi:hypothetical protein
MRAEKGLAALQVKSVTAENEAKRCQLVPFMDDCCSILEAIPVLQVRAPNVTFDRRLTLHGIILKFFGRLPVQETAQNPVYIIGCKKFTIL